MLTARNRRSFNLIGALAALRSKGVSLAYVTLHVGAGTFLPVRDDDVRNHVMHSEWYRLPPETVAAIAAAKARGGRVVAVGTTSMRTLEAASQSAVLVAAAGETKLFIAPGYPFQTVERLVTNFHLPKSTLMMLVSAFAGREHVMADFTIRLRVRSSTAPTSRVDRCPTATPKRLSVPVQAAPPALLRDRREDARRGSVVS